MPVCVKMEQCLSQQTKTYHHVHLRVALRWLWSNSVRHLMMRTCWLSRHPFRLLTRMQQLWSPNTRIFLSFCYKAHSHQIAMMSISYLDEPTPAIFRDAKKTPVRVCATTFFSHKLMGQCDTSARLYDISKNVPLKRLSADDTFTQNARNFWGMPVETTRPLQLLVGNNVIMEVPWWDVGSLEIQPLPEEVSTDKTAVMSNSLLPTRSCLRVYTCRWFPG